MSATISELARIVTTDAGNPYNFTEVTPASNSVLIVMFSLTVSGATFSVSDSGMGLTWTHYDGDYSPYTNHHMQIWWAPVPASPVATVVSINTLVNSLCASAELYQIENGNKTSPILQYKTGLGHGTTASLTFDSSLDTDNAYAALCIVNAGGHAFTVQTGWTKDSDTGFDNPTERCDSQHRSNGETTALTVNFTSIAGSAQDWSEAIVEIAVAAPPPLGRKKRVGMWF
jgi:hypothetical protein